MRNRSGFVELIGLLIVAALLLGVASQAPNLRIRGKLADLAKGTNATFTTGSTTSFGLNVPTPFPIPQNSTTISYQTLVQIYEKVSTLSVCKGVITPEMIAEVSKLQQDPIAQFQAWQKAHPNAVPAALACKESIWKLIQSQGK